MNSNDFCYWLQGFFELSNNNQGLSKQQTQIIQDHLNLVFNKKTPSYNSKMIDNDKVESISKWLSSEEGQKAMADAAESARKQIDDLNRCTTISYEDLNKPIC